MSETLSGTVTGVRVSSDRLNSDHDLLRAFAAERNETAFAELVGRHAALVYASAMRQTADPHKAEEVVQAVFILLSRKAGSLGPEVPLGPWLFRAAVFASRDLLKSERRRFHREQIAYSMNPMDKTPAPDPGAESLWERVAPVLDDCLSRLSEGDRRAIWLRFFEEKSLAEVGETLGVEEDAARKRVSRAIAKLQALLARRGAEIDAGDLPPVLGSRSARLAPAGLAAATVAAVLSATPKASAAALGATVGKQLLWTQWKWWIAAAAAATVGGVSMQLSRDPDRVSAGGTSTAIQKDDYSAAGFADAARVHDFIAELQEATLARDAAALARLVDFPLRVNASGGPLRIADAAQLATTLEVVLPQTVSAMVIKCPKTRLHAEARGVMIGTGEVWIAPRPDARGVAVPKVIAINAN